MVNFNYYGILFISFAVLAQASYAHICDTCDCQPSRNGVFSIICDCESTKHLHFTSSMMMGVDTASMVIIKDCQTVSIERNSFSQLGKLDTLAIQNCLRLYLAAGAFSSLNSLLINNVNDISFGEMALMGARGVKNIIINTSNITDLPKYSLYDVDGIDKFSFNEVNIGKIHGNAFNLTAKSITIDNSKFNYTETNGLIMQAQKVMIHKSEFHIAEPNSIQIKTEFQTRLLENHFRGFFQLNITSPFAELFGNRFQNFDSKVLAKVQSAQLMNNLIFDSDYEMIFRRSYHKDFHDNGFVCRCGMNLLNSTKDSNNYEILRKNYCMTNCSLSLFDFEVESISRCMRDGRVDVTSFCNYERTHKNDPRTSFSTEASDIEDANFALRNIQPRFLVPETTEKSAGEQIFGQKLNLALTIFVVVFASYFY